MVVPDLSRRTDEILLHLHNVLCLYPTCLSHHSHSHRSSYLSLAVLTYEAMTEQGKVRRS